KLPSGASAYGEHRARPGGRNLLVAAARPALAWRSGPRPLPRRARQEPAAMLSLTGRTGVRHCDGLTRRELLRAGAVGLGGLTLPGLLRLEHAAAAAGRKARA